MGLFSQRNPRKEITTTVKTYGVEYDKEPTKQKKGLFGIKKKEPEPQPQQDTMQIENPNQEQNETQEENQNYGGIN